MDPLEVARAHGIDAAELLWTEVVLTVSGPVAVVTGTGRALDLDLARAAVHDPSARLASHEEVRAFARGCEVGAVPPLSRFLGAPVIVDEPVGGMDQVVFPAGRSGVLLCVARADLFAAEPVGVARLSRGAGELSLVAPSRRALFSGVDLVPYHLRNG
jgi:prolyl-tRNA editing enzyme YbaK/EbsC (Cys-tRNA(Pro) deacylase)